MPESIRHIIRAAGIHIRAAGRDQHVQVSLRVSEPASGHPGFTYEPQDAIMRPACPIWLSPPPRVPSAASSTKGLTYEPQNAIVRPACWMKLSPPPRAPSATSLLRGNNCPQLYKPNSISSFQTQLQQLHGHAFGKVHRFHFTE